MPSETGRPVPYLGQVALDFPELRIVAGHIGFPWIDEMVELVWKHENVYIDTSVYLSPLQLLHYLKTYSRVMFGSNVLQLPFGRCVVQVLELDLPEDIRAEFICGNAAGVFGL